MFRLFAILSLVALVELTCARCLAIDAPGNLVHREGDRTVVLHWDRVTSPDLSAYRVYRAPAPAGPFTLQITTGTPGFCDFNAVNGVTNYYRVTALSKAALESPPSPVLAGSARPFANDEVFLDYIQQVHFDYFWYGANPVNGLIPDRSSTTSPCSIAAVGFGLSAIPVGVQRGWITREQGAERVRTTLRTFFLGPQGPGVSGTIGYRGWFYHFLDMNTAVRFTPFNTELSSIDTALFLAGALHSRAFFTATNTVEAEIRSLATQILERVDWTWMARGTDMVSLGWHPESGFLPYNWVGYNEAMLLYILGLGANENPLPASSWQRWTNGYSWATHYGQSFLVFPPLFGHQYSHCWVDFRHVADPYMMARESTYFENSRRATLAQRAYCIANPLGRTGYSSNVWGITASDIPGGYQARGAPPPQNDNGTIAPTAVGGSVAFAPEVTVPALRYFYANFRRNIWTSYGFRDAFNLGVQWWGPDTLGIDQGPIVLMIENHRSGSIWRQFMQNPEIQRGLERAGFKRLRALSPRIEPAVNGSMRLFWESTPGRFYQVEYSSNLEGWSSVHTGAIEALGPTVEWVDGGLPSTSSSPASNPVRFYRVFQFGAP